MSVAEWAAIASLATAAGTLVLAVATFASVRSANKSARAADRTARVAEQSARIAERSLLAAQRPLLVNSRPNDVEQKVVFADGKSVPLPGGQAAALATEGAIYLAISVRNVGTGIAVVLGWHVMAGIQRERTHPELESFTSQIRDIYVAPGDVGYWQGTLRDPGADGFSAIAAALEKESMLTVSLLYGDFEGGQRVITQFAMRSVDHKWRAAAGRHFNVDRPDPR